LDELAIARPAAPDGGPLRAWGCTIAPAVPRLVATARGTALAMSSDMQDTVRSWDHWPLAFVVALWALLWGLFMIVQPAM
jgi:hypothetical protein